MDPNIVVAIRTELEDDIRRGRLAAGELLHQEALAERFAVSRQPIRLAIEALRAAGLVVARRGRGVEVAAQSEAGLRELMAVRRLVEREALALALPRLGERDLLEARQLQERIEIELDPKAIEALDCAFHRTLYRPCGNARLVRLSEELRREDVTPYRAQPPGSPSRERFAREHRALLAACADKDGARALALLDTHLSERSPE